MTRKKGCSGCCRLPLILVATEFWMERESETGLSGNYPTPDHVVNLLVNAVRLVKPVHHKPGSIKLRISLFDLPRLISLVPGLDVTEEVKGILGILGYQVHVLLTSATIAYDPEIISFDFWETFCRVKREPESENLLKTRLKKLIHVNETVTSTQGPETVA